MTKSDWQALLRRLEISTRIGKLSPVAAPALDEFEREHGIKLPQSYRTFCEVFGPGEFSERFRVAIPGYAGEATAFSLEHLDHLAHAGQEYDEYSKDPEQHKRGLFFCVDLRGSFHFFDPAEVTDRRRCEYAVYTVFRDYELRKTADNFWQFVTESCLGEEYHCLIAGSASPQIFLPVGV